MEAPLVSIITPAFNSEKFIRDAILSVQQQSWKNWEMIIVDDCSTDNTVAIVSAIAAEDPRIKYFTLAVNSGTGVARNTALEKTSGAYIAFLDADDLWKPLKLEKQLEYMMIHKQPFTFSFYDCINENGEFLHRKVKAPLRLSYLQLFFCNYVGNLTGIYEVAYFGRIEIASIRKRQDWMMWLSILKRIKSVKPVPESLAYYRIRQNSISASKMDLIRHNFSVYRSFHHFNWLLSACCMAVFLFTQLFIKPFYIKKVRD